MIYSCVQCRYVRILGNSSRCFGSDCKIASITCICHSHSTPHVPLALLLTYQSSSVDPYWVRYVSTLGGNGLACQTTYVRMCFLTVIPLLPFSCVPLTQYCSPFSFQDAITSLSISLTPLYLNELPYSNLDCQVHKVRTYACICHYMCTNSQENVNVVSHKMLYAQILCILYTYVHTYSL